MQKDVEQQILKRLDEISDRLAMLERNQEFIARSSRRASIQRLWRRPPMWTFEQYPPRWLDVTAFRSSLALPADAPRIAIVTPSFNHAKYLIETIDSVLNQNYPRLHYHVQDGASVDGTVELLKNYRERISWRSE